MVTFIIVIIVIFSLAIIIPKIISNYKDKQRKNKALQLYQDLIEKNKMENCQHISYKNIVRMDIDNKSKKLGAFSYYENESIILKFNEILDFEIFENGNSVISSRTGSAVAGGLIFGGLGAVAGASGSRTINENASTVKLKIYTNNIKNSVVTLDFLEKSISKVSNEYEEIRDVINKMISFLKIAREDNRQIERKEDKKVIIENVDDIKSENNVSSIKELAELKDKGIITQEEFEKSKKRILEKL